MHQADARTLDTDSARTAPGVALRADWVAFRTIVMKEIRRFLRIWPQTLVPPAISMVLYFLIFGAFIGRRIGEMGGLDYMAFIVPGLIMMAVITNAYSNVASSFYSTKFQRSIETILVSPVPHGVLLGGFVAGGVARGLAVGAIVTVMAGFFIEFEIHSYAVTIGMILLTAVLFSLGGFVNAVFADKFDDISIIPAFVLTPLTYLGGVFYSIDLLPPFWRSLSYLNPIVYMVASFRYGFFGYDGGIPVGMAFAAIVVFVIAFWLFALLLLRRGTGLRS
ncbi:MAG: ABC transporter permease [Pseudomonadales bacterium]|jgi:ABC-2 type transport system permease protein|nr:ABC transporter permease [Pseudomonadales bacterium]